MIVYVYDKTTNEKKYVNKNVCAIVSTPYSFLLTDNKTTITVPKENVKLTVYGF